MIKCPEGIYLSEERFALAHSSTPSPSQKGSPDNRFLRQLYGLCPWPKKNSECKQLLSFPLLLMQFSISGHCPAHKEYVFPPQSAQWGHALIHKPRGSSLRWVLDSVNLTAPTITLLTLCSWLDSMDISDGVEEMETLLKYLRSVSVRKQFFHHPS